MRGSARQQLRRRLGSQRLAVPGGGAPPTINAVFGSLSNSGVASGVPVTGTSITSGNAAGKFQIVSGQLCPVAAADLGTGPYAFTLNNGQTANVTIEANCWSVSTQAEWDRVIAQATATLSGKIIRVRRLPSNAVYTSGVDGAAARLRRADYAGLVIKGDDPNGMPANSEDDLAASTFPIFDRFVLRGTRNVTLRNLDTAPTPVLKFSLIAEAANHLENVTIEGCRVRGQPMDPNGNYTGRTTDLQFATGDGVTTTFNYTAPYVPQPSTADVLFYKPAGVSPNPQGFRIVAGGVTAANAGSAGTLTGDQPLTGAGVASGAVNYTTGVATVTFSSPPGNGVPITTTHNTQWFYPNADLIVVAGAAADIGGISINNNFITWALRGINATPGNALVSALNTNGNRIKYVYDDGINVVYGGVINNAWNCDDNVISHPIGVGTDVGNPHVDMIRAIGSIAAATDWTVNLHRNRMWHGNSRGDYQGILLSDFKTIGGDSGKFFIATMVGNATCYQTTQAFAVENAKDCVLLNNTVVAGDVDPAGLVQMLVGTGSTYSTTSGTHRLERNISEAYTVGGTPTLVNNQTLAESEAAYSAMFTGSVDWDVETLAELMATFSRKTGGPGDLGGGPPDAGAIGSAAVTWATSVPGSDGANLVS